ncbi:MAG: hypothetical protein INF43_00870 [Alphaproteobacteria bacterium]|nr:hypothetical protein [Alphaproteobacteria bacterium]
MKTRKIGLLGAGLLALLAGPAWAVSLVDPVTLNFGKTDYALPLTGTIALGTDGTVAYSGAFDGSGVGAAGQLRLQDTPGTVVEIACADGTLAHSGGATLALEGGLAVGAANVGTYGAALACDGLGTVLTTHSLTAQNSENIIFFGGRLTPTSLQAGAYTTTNTGGVPLAVRVVVQ